jgi:hypothetical protein
VLLEIFDASKFLTQTIKATRRQVRGDDELSEPLAKLGLIGRVPVIGWMWTSSPFSPSAHPQTGFLRSND